MVGEYRYVSRWAIGKGPVSAFDDSARVDDMVMSRAIQRRVPFVCWARHYPPVDWHEWLEPGERRRVECPRCGAVLYHTEPVGDRGVNP